MSQPQFGAKTRLFANFVYRLFVGGVGIVQPDEVSRFLPARKPCFALGARRLTEFSLAQPTAASAC